jgi:hypothetical protein
MSDNNESLNAGNELDDNPAPMITEKESDIDTDLKGISDSVTALESVFKDIAYLHSDIKKSGGMNQSFAMEAIASMPNFGDNTPVGYYSKDLSATRLKISLEEITTGMWGIIAAVAAAIIAAIYKLYKWLSGDKEDAAEGDALKKCDDIDAALSKTPEIAADTSAIVTELNDIVRNNETIVTGKSGNSIKITNLQEVIDEVLSDEAAERFNTALSTKDKFAMDFIKRGEFSTAINAIGIVLPAHVNSIKDSYNTLKSAMIDVIENRIDKAEAQLTALEARSFNTFKVGSDNLTASEANAKLRELHKTMLSKSLVPERTDIEVLIKRVSDSALNKEAQRMVTSIRTSVRFVDSLKIIMEDIEHECKKLTTRAKGVADTDVLATLSKRINKADSVLRSEILGILALVVVLKQSTNEVGNYIALVITGVMDAIKLLVDNLGKDRKGEEAWIKLNHVMYDLQKDLKQFKEPFTNVSMQYAKKK